MDNSIERIIKKEIFNEIDVAYPIYVTNYEIRKITDINKIYAVLTLTKFTNAVTTIKIKYQMFTAFGELIKEAEQIIQNSTKTNILTVNLPLHNDTNNIKVSILECLMANETVIANKVTNILTDSATKIENANEVAVAKKYVPNAVVYSKEFSDFWYCACGALNLQDNGKCIACGVKKEVSLQNVNKQNLTEIIAKEQEEKAKTTEKAYLSAIKLFDNSKTLEDYKYAISAFKALGNYKDSKLYIEKCNEKSAPLENKKKRRNIIITLASVALVGVIAFLCSLPGIIENNNYKKIANYLKDGDLNSAYTAIDELEDFNSFEVPSDDIIQVVIDDGVTTIKPELFKGFKNLKSVTIPNSVTSIGDYAFEGCTSLTSITIPNSVTSIGDAAFYNCDNLTSVTIPDSVTSIGEIAFSGCPIETATIPTIAIEAISNKSLKTVTLTSGLSIGEGAFSGCTNLTSVTIHDSVIRINDYAFNGCTKLASIAIPNSVDIIGKRAFYNCTSLTSVTIPNSVTSIGDEAFYSCDNLTSVIIGDGVSHIGKYAFYNCTSLANITIGNNVTYIGDSAFYKCPIKTARIPTTAIKAIKNTSLKTVILTGGESIGNSAFYNCTNLTSVTIPNSVTSIGDNAFSGCTSLTSIAIPNSVTSIGSSAFERCTSLTSVNISNNVTSIGDNAFYNCTNLTSVTIPDSVISIGEDAFYKCANLTSVIIGNNVTSIGDNTFYNCTSLANITIGNNVTSIGSSTFSGCTNLEKVYYLGDINSWVQIEFASASSTPLYYAKELYINNELATTANITTATKISNDAFYGYDKLTSVTIGNSVTSIGSFAFKDCDKLTNVTIGNSVTSIGDNAFRGCTSLTSVTIPNNVTSIGSQAFNDCASLKMLVIGNGVTKLSKGLLYGCSSLESITLPFVGEEAGVTSSDTYQYPFGYIFGTSSYTGATATKQYYHGSSTSSTTNTTYYIPSTLKSVTVTGGNILYGAFFTCTNLTSVTIGNGVKSIGGYAFAGCIKLTSVAIPNSVTSIGEYAFFTCTNLTSVNIPDSVTSIGSQAFNDCASLKMLVIGNGVTKLSKGLMYGCSSLESITLPFVGGSKTGLYGTSSSLFGYIFGTNTYTGATSVKQYYGSSSSSYSSYYIPSTLKSVTVTGGNISYGAFYNCTNLISVTIGNNVTSIDENAFYNTGIYNNEDNWINGVLYIDNWLISKKTSISGSYTIKEGTVGIANEVFYNCDNLTSVTIPNSVTSIGDDAFYSCDNLEKVYYLGDINGWVQIEFSDYFSNPLYYAKELYINNELVTTANITMATEIKDNVFYDYDKLTSITIGNSVTSIGYLAFDDCDNLTSVTIGNSVTSIGRYAFRDCTSITKIIIPSSVTYIDYGAFYGWSYSSYSQKIYCSVSSEPSAWNSDWKYGCSASVTWNYTGA